MLATLFWQNIPCDLRSVETIVQRLLVSLRKGASGEAILAVRGLGLHFLTLGLQPEAER